MSNSLRTLLNQKEKVFAIVGAAHLLGDDTVQDYLGAEGYRFERVAPTGRRTALIDPNQAAESPKLSVTDETSAMRAQVQWPGQPSERQGVENTLFYRTPDGVMFTLSTIEAPSTDAATSLKMICELTSKAVESRLNGPKAKMVYNLDDNVCLFRLMGSAKVMGMVKVAKRKVYLLNVAVPPSADFWIHNDAIQRFFQTFELVPVAGP